MEKNNIEQMKANYDLVGAACQKLGAAQPAPGAAQCAAPDAQAALEAARNAAYPVPDSPHSSVNLLAVADRMAFTRGWEAARHCVVAAAQPEAKAAPALGTLTDDEIMDMAEPFHYINGVQFDEVSFARAILAAAGNSQDAKDAAPSALVGGSHA